MPCESSPSCGKAAPSGNDPIGLIVVLEKWSVKGGPGSEESPGARGPS
jgi:hypothetical protein